MTRIVSINGIAHEVPTDARISLLELVRDQLGLSGTKRGCDSGACGACTVLLDGRAVNACILPAIACGGHTVETVEGPHADEALRLQAQASFARHDALQCGYCTPGQVMAAVGLARQDPLPLPQDVAEAMSGNLCRCGAYPNIRDAVVELIDWARRR